MEYSPLILEVLRKIEQETPESFAFHNIVHTRLVMENALMLGSSEGLSERELHLLMVAAAFHDAGMLQGREEHEARSIVAVKEAMQTGGEYTDGEVSTVCQMIADTKLNRHCAGPIQVPKTRLSRYLCDADLAGFGDQSFLVNSRLIASENGVPFDYDFIADCLSLLERHGWQTESAAKLWQTQKEQNVLRLRELLREQDEAS